jgi:hypothetical protein
MSCGGSEIVAALFTSVVPIAWIALIVVVICKHRERMKRMGSE